MERMEAIKEFMGFSPFVHKLPSDYPPYITCPMAVTGLVISVSLWRIAYVVTRKYNKDDIAHRTLAVAKGLLAVIATLLVGNLNENAFHGDFLNSWSQSIVMICSSGFFVHDSLFFAYYSIDDIVNLVHHIITFTALMYSTVIGKYASLIMFYHWAFESSSVPLHLRYIMKRWKINVSHPDLFTITELAFILMYTAERFIIGMHFSFKILCISGEIIPFIPKILCVVVNLASLAFYNSVFHLFVRRYGDEFEFLKNFFPPV